MFRLTLRAFSASSPFRIIGKRRAGSSGGDKLKYVEPTGFLFNRRASVNRRRGEDVVDYCIVEYLL